tara:strand:- start:125 stop:769 length:645 start_codon:yes stop_codon:yes gene_type:complete
MLILKSKLFIFFLLPFVSAAQGYLFNKDTLALFYKGYTNSFEINNNNVENTGTPLCFDGSIKIIPDQNSHENAKYYIEVLDTVTRNRGKLNISKHLTHPDGFIEKVFIDKFEFKIIPFPETILFVGSSSPGEKIDPKNMDLKVGIKETIPETTFRIEEYTIIANKETITIKSHETTQQAIGFIMKQAKGKEIKINAIYVDSIKKQRKVSGVFYL